MGDPEIFKSIKIKINGGCKPSLTKGMTDGKKEEGIRRRWWGFSFPTTKDGNKYGRGED